MLVLVFVIVLKDSLRTRAEFLSLSLTVKSWSLSLTINFLKSLFLSWSLIHKSLSWSWSLWLKSLLTSLVVSLCFSLISVMKWLAQMHSSDCISVKFTCNFILFIRLNRWQQHLSWRAVNCRVNVRLHGINMWDGTECWMQSVTVLQQCQLQWDC